MEYLAIIFLLQTDINLLSMKIITGWSPEYNWHDSNDL